ncbi:hypothetical protein N431DRAFT_442007 [Stipitochalara longipes BDJ]|nr:hypothetical protein N431DRAFT_442007 [Stipitochalara longipes BDJ]
MSQSFLSEVERLDDSSAVPLTDFKPHFTIARKAIPSSRTTTSNEADPPTKGYSTLKDTEVAEYSRERTGIFRYWWFECISCFFVFAALIAIVSILLPHDGKPTPQWPYQISINTVVAIFINILKFAMILVVAEGLSHRKWAWFGKHRLLHDVAKYDMASRGALGSMKLLHTLRGRDWISCLGALLTIGALALDPFAQQLVQHFSCSIEDASMQATIPRANMYFETGPHLFAGYSAMPAAVEASIALGLYFNGTEEVPFNCPTGTCRFAQQYHSIAYCNSCTDMTSKLVYSSNATTDTDSWTLPSGVQLSSNAETPTYFIMDGSMSEGIEMIFRMVEYETGIAPTTSECPSSNKETFGCNGIGAASCSMFPCVRTYSASIENGNLTEQVVSNWSDLGQSTTTYNAANVACMSAEDRRNATEAGYIIEPDTEWLAYKTSIGAYGEGWTGEASNSVIKGIISEQCLYEIGIIATNGLDLWSASFFNGEETKGSAKDWPTGPSVVDLFYQSLSESASLATIDHIFGNIADSLTVHMRQNGDHVQSVNASNPAMGSVIRSDTCVRVHWGWLSYPIVMALLTFVFFVSIILGSRHRNGGLGWKSSPLALVYHGLDETILDQYEHKRLDNIEAMVEASKQLQVQLTRTIKGWKFVA